MLEIFTERYQCDKGRFQFCGVDGLGWLSTPKFHNFHRLQRAIEKTHFADSKKILGSGVRTLSPGNLPVTAHFFIFQFWGSRLLYLVPDIIIRPKRLLDKKRLIESFQRMGKTSTLDNFFAKIGYMNQKTITVTSVNIIYNLTYMST